MRQYAKFFLRKMSQLIQGLEGYLRATLPFAIGEIYISIGKGKAASLCHPAK